MKREFRVLDASNKQVSFHFRMDADDLNDTIEVDLSGIGKWIPSKFVVSDCITRLGTVSPAKAARILSRCLVVETELTQVSVGRM